MVKERKWFVGLLMAFLLVSVSQMAHAEFKRYLVNENFSYDNSSFWSISNVCVAQYCYFNHILGGFAGLNLTAGSWGDLSLISGNIVFDSAYRYNVNTTFFQSTWNNNWIFYFGFGYGLSGYPKGYFKLTDHILDYVSSSGTRNIDSLDSVVQYDLSWVYYNKNVEIYLNNSLKFSEVDTSFVNPSRYTINNYLAGGSGGSTANWLFLDGLNISEWQEGIVANFSILDEVGTFPITSLIYLYLYDANGILLNSTSSNTGVASLSNLNYQKYKLVYHDSIYNRRIISFTPNQSLNQYTIYLLNNSCGVPTTFFVKDFGTDKLVIGANINLYKSINFTPKLIFDDDTDMLGSASTFLNVTDVYNIEISKTGYETLTGIVNTQVYPYQFIFYLHGNSSSLPSINLTEGITDFSVSQKHYPENTYLTNLSYELFWFYVANTNGKLENVSITSLINGVPYYSQGLNGYTNNVSINTYPLIGDVWIDVNFSYKLVNKSIVTKTIRYYLENVSAYAPATQDLNNLKDSFTISQKLMLVSIVAIVVTVLLVFVVPFGYSFIGACFVWGMFLLKGWFEGYSWIVGIILVVGLVFLLTRGDSFG